MRADERQQVRPATLGDADLDAGQPVAPGDGRRGPRGQSRAGELVRVEPLIADQQRQRAVALVADARPGRAVGHREGRRGALPVGERLADERPHAQPETVAVADQLAGRGVEHPVAVALG